MSEKPGQTFSWLTYEDICEAEQRLERLTRLAGRSGLRRFSEFITRTAMCIGGPEHGRSMTVEGAEFVVAKLPDSATTIPASNQTESMRFTEGHYVLHLLDTPEPEPLYVWAWQGWGQ